MNELAFFTAMQQAMDGAAKDTWNMVSYSRQHRSPSPLRLGEVTLIELNFYRLRNFWTKQVFLLTHEPVEAKTGADWEWVIGHDGKWIAIRAQAKVLGTGANIGKFPHLSHKVKSSGIRQIDLLTDPAPGTTPCRWMPLYVFYASSPPLTNFPQTSQGAARYGCSTAHARAIRQILDHKTRGNTRAGLYLGIADRWSSIFDPLVSQLKKKQTLASIVDNLYDKPLPRSSLRTADFWDASQSAGTCSNRLPHYLDTIVERRYDDFTSADIASLVVKTPQQKDAKMQTRVELQPPSTVAEAPIKELQHPDLAYADKLLRDILDEDPRYVDSILNQARSSVDHIGINPSAREALPTRELILDIDRETNIIQSLPSLVTLIDIDQIGTKKP
jgi:hypothetical protein